MKIAEAIKSNDLNLRIDYGSRRLVGNKNGDGFEVINRPHYARNIRVVYIGKDEDSAVAALIGDDESAVAHWTDE